MSSGRNIKMICLVLNYKTNTITFSNFRNYYFVFRKQICIITSMELNFLMKCPAMHFFNGFVNHFEEQYKTNLKLHCRVLYLKIMLYPIVFPIGTLSLNILRAQI